MPNLVRQSEDFTLFRTLNQCVVTADQDTDPNGSTAADLVSPSTGASNAFIQYEAVGAKSASRLTHTVWIRSATGTSISSRLMLAGNISGNFAVSSITISTAYERFSVTGDSGASDTTINGRIGGENTLSDGDNIYVFGRQVEPGNIGDYVQTAGSPITTDSVSIRGGRLRSKKRSQF